MFYLNSREFFNCNSHHQFLLIFTECCIMKWLFYTGKHIAFHLKFRNFFYCNCLHFLIDKHWIINHHKQIFLFKNTYCVSLEIQRILSFEYPVPWLISRNGTLCVHPVIMTLKMTLNTIISTMTKYKSINFIYLWKIVKNIAVSSDLWHSVAQECSK